VSASTPEQEIVEHYERYDEERRLSGDLGPLEAARTRELIQRFLPPPPAVILDVGGAAGAYSFWLAGLGHAVHLVDLVPRHVERAAEHGRNAGVPHLASLGVGDARHLAFGDGQADAIVMHGPLYHLAAREDRLRALAEAARVLRPGGVLLAFAITRYAGLVYGITRGHVFDPEYRHMITHEVRTGHRVDPPDWVLTLPNAFFHLPSELAAEAEEAGLRVEALLGVIGPAWLVPDLEAAWKDPARRDAILEMARLAEHEPALGPRILAVARKQTPPRGP
jgi:ubiquinone/menaquinone biosynthesis C-methylase UbiE